MDTLKDLLTSGLSGWIVYIIGALLSGCLGYRIFIKRRTTQTKIKSGGDVAGGDITKGDVRPSGPNGSTKRDCITVQDDITAKGDVAGGNITKAGK